MPIKLQTTFRNFAEPILADERIHERVVRLERIYPRIMSVHVVAEESHRRHHTGKLFQVRIDVKVPGGEIVVNRDHHDKHAHADFFVALRDAFAAMESQLKTYAAKQSGDTKTHEAPPHGKVTLIYPDYGFITSDDGLQFYFHANSVVDGKFDDLDIGSEVRFVAAENESEKGPQATTVHPVGKHHLG